MPSDSFLSDSQANLFNTVGIVFAAVGGLVPKPFVRFLERDSLLLFLIF
jgi:hypothetical protein